MQSELMATREQAEEYRLGLEEEQKRHERTKENMQSLTQQWKDMYQELQAKKKEVGYWKAEVVVKSKVNSNVDWCCMFECFYHAHTHNHFMDFVRDNPGESVPKETFIHSRLSWSSIILYLFPLSIVIYGILPVQFTCFYQQDNILCKFLYEY